MAHAIPPRYARLVATGAISGADLNLAIATARLKGAHIDEILIEAFQVSGESLGESLACCYGVPYEPSDPTRPPPPPSLRLPRAYVEEHEWLPIDETPEGLVILATDPERARGSRAPENVFPGRRLVFRVTSVPEFRRTVAHAYEQHAMDDLLARLDDGEDADLAADNELVKLVNKIIIDAYNMGASDIHIEPYPGKGKTEIRFRRDGSLMPYIEVPASYRSAIVTRIKIMCDLDISEKRRPQDGKIKFKKFGPLDIELRVATIPTAGGMEDVVMRILAAGEPIPLDKLGLSEHNRKRLMECIEKPYGLFFVCGPTGSGKTTTLHSILKHLNTPENKIWTAEDPVEITQKGLRQVQINPKAGLTFATAMRSFLRADPDIIMVGEMRDKETTSIGIEASLTGHLVFATLHTNSAPESIVRLLDMGMDPFNFADALLSILAQRLAKRLCTQCKRPRVAAPEDIKRLLAEYTEELKNVEWFRRDPAAAVKGIYGEWRAQYAGASGQFTLYEPAGCEHCSGTGYRGRIGLHELLVCTDDIRRHIQGRSPVSTIALTAMAQGMRTLKQDGIEKVLQGLTDMPSVRAVCIK